MGYESRLYVGELNNGYFSEIARLDICKMDYKGAFHSLLGKSSSIDKEYVWDDNGNTKITEDCYGERLKKMSLSDIVTSFGQEVEDDTYRRLRPALIFFKTLLEQQEKGLWREIVILHYGY